MPDDTGYRKSIDKKKVKHSYFPICESPPIIRKRFQSSVIECLQHIITPSSTVRYPAFHQLSWECIPSDKRHENAPFEPMMIVIGSHRKRQKEHSALRSRRAKKKCLDIHRRISKTFFSPTSAATAREKAAESNDL